MTDLDLICEEPFLIGLLGAISFMSFSIGSLLITRVIDIYGRRPVLLIATLVTPIGILMLISVAKSLVSLYVIIFVIGLTYNTRSSTAYLYATEFICKQKHLQFG